LNRFPRFCPLSFLEEETMMQRPKVLVSGTVNSRVPSNSNLSDFQVIEPMILSSVIMSK